MTLGDLTTQFVGMMNRNELRQSAALASLYISQAILRIQRELRTPMQEATVLYTIPTTYVPSVGLAIPSDFLELIGIYAGANQEYELTRGAFNKVKSMATCGSGPCRQFTRLGGNWIIGPPPNAGDVVMFQYYASFPAVVAPTDTNTLLTVAWDLVLYSALCAACTFYDDVRFDKFNTQYNTIAEALQNMADGDELTADAAVGPVYAWPDDGNET